MTSSTETHVTLLDLNEQLNFDIGMKSLMFFLAYVGGEGGNKIILTLPNLILTCSTTEVVRL